MIPLKLQLKNFLSYGPTFQTIDFGAYHLICLSGKNGHGKSALLDAMTWAIWGQARKTSGTNKPDAQLLRLGQTHMMVIFDFYFNGNNYRIRREYSETYNKPYASLDFAVIDSDTQKVIPLTDKTIRHTQEKIELTLGLDFESFVNSAFLRQGQANEFSKKSPKERKDILATILNLQQYEAIRRLATEKTKDAMTEVNATQQIINRLLAEFQTTEQVINQLTNIVDALLNLENEMATANLMIEQLKTSAVALEEQLQQYQLLMLQLNHKETHQQGIQKVISDLFAQWRFWNKQLKLLATLETDQFEQTKTLAMINQLQQQLQKNLEIKEQLLSLKEQEQKIIKQLEQLNTAQLQKYIIEQEKLDYEIQQLHNNIQVIESNNKQYNEDLLLLSNQLKKLTNLEVNINVETVEKQFEKRKTYYQIWLSRLQSTTNELQELEQKKLMVQDSNNPCCPLCEQNLSASRKRFLKIKFIKLKHYYQHRIKRLSQLLKQLKQLLIQQHTELTKQKEIQLKQHQEKALQKELTNQQEKLIQNRAAGEAAKNKILNQLKQLQATKIESEHQQHNFAHTVQKQIDSDMQLIQIRAHITNYEQILNNNKINANDYVNAQERLTQLAKAKEQYQKLSQEKEYQQQRKNKLTSLFEELRSLKKECLHLKLKAMQFDSIKIDYKNIHQQIIHKTGELNQLQNKKNELMHEKGKLETINQMRVAQEQEIKQLRNKLKSLECTIQDYYEIAAALSKEGIQALLIEEALPEIEQEANLLLGQLTNNQAHIFIESLRDLKKGGTKETLDIKISDSLGIRPYELFSGGEAFRIDFALRIAISKLLARRAGTSLQTLIIDEGFGSQDEEGITNLMDAIYKIQNHFAKVIIVSHLPIIKDQFPVHFLVEKGPNGSSIRILEQG